MDVIDKYLDTLLEQFNPNTEVAQIKADMNEEWTNCFDSRCARIEVNFDKQFCKASCVAAAASRAVNRISALKGACGAAKNPGSCLKKLDNNMKMLRNKVEKAREDQRKARAKAAEFRRKLATGV